ncbi:hypothetical protein HKW97_23365 (plasmid) [Pseudomonas luteola]|uniref:hypothetical protein n=1 Tax=Pseudomonas luteola TaxID=47886 RepID=UPI003890F5CC
MSKECFAAEEIETIRKLAEHVSMKENLGTNRHRYWISPRIYLNVNIGQAGFGTIERWEQQVVDNATKQFLFKSIEFERGNSSGFSNDYGGLSNYKFWEKGKARTCSINNGNKMRSTLF